MKGKFLVISFVEKLIKVNLRVVVMTLVLLIAFDVSLRLWILPHYLDPNAREAGSGTASMEVPAIKRLPADDLNTLTLWKNEMQSQSGFKVVFLGDSVVHGGGVPDEKSTIPAYFARELKVLLPGKDVKVYNFSLPGCTPNDTYNIYRFVADVKPDLIIYDTNIGWFGSKNIMEHPRLAELSKAPASSPAQQGSAKKKEFDLEETLASFASDHWSLYRNRIFLNYVWFGKPLRERLVIDTTPKEQKEADQLTDKKELYKPWYEKNFDVLKKTKGKLGYVGLNDYNQHWVMYKKLMAEIKQDRINTVIFMVPRNVPLYRKYNLIDDKVLEERQASLASVAADSGVPAFDYTYVVNDRYFTDSVHLTADGNRIIAERLAWDIVNKKVIK
ncbi:MAG: hypothetical protein ACM3PP_12350 [Candidatus Saccharibacteria bacterium]